MNYPMLLLLFLTSFVLAGASKQHTVGDSIWSIPPHNDFYSNWSSSYSFHVGDSLYFDFELGFYDVNLVSRTEFDGCSWADSVEVFVDGPVVFPLWRKGAFYFVCGVANYCSLGMKVDVVVEEPAAVGSGNGPEISPVLGPYPSQSPSSHVW